MTCLANTATQAGGLAMRARIQAEVRAAARVDPEAVRAAQPRLDDPAVTVERLVDLVAVHLFGQYPIGAGRARVTPRFGIRNGGFADGSHNGRRRWTSCRSMTAYCIPF